MTAGVGVSPHFFRQHRLEKNAGLTPTPTVTDRFRKWRNAVDLHHLPEGTHCLANRPGSLARLAFQKWWAWGDLHPQGCQILNLDRLLLGLNHMPKWKW